MNSRTHIRAKKKVIDASKWTQGAIPKGRFPLYRDRKPLGDTWWWRAAELESDTNLYRLLVQIRTDKPNFKAWLAVKIDEHWAMMGRLESHMHAGRHIHLQCPEKGIAVGQIDPPDMIFIPAHRRPHRHPNVVLSPAAAWALAVKFFRAQAADVGDLGI